jgi:hypothetical protein
MADELQHRWVVDAADARVAVIIVVLVFVATLKWTSLGRVALA